jgi:hypothetical protein
MEKRTEFQMNRMVKITEWSTEQNDQQRRGREQNEGGKGEGEYLPG